MTITRFKELFVTAARVDDILWPDLFREFSKCVPFLGERHPGWSPAEFEPAERCLENVKRINALALDYDNKTKGGDRVTEPVTVEQARELFQDYYGLIHTTRSHTRDWPRFRVILPLTRSISRFEYAALWAVAARQWPGLDPQPKDASRFWYTPGVGDHEGAEFEAHTLTGAYLNPDELLDQKPLLAIPAPSTGPTDAQRETRARAYIAKMPEAISGAGGHNDLWRVTRKLVCDFGLDEQSAFRIISTEYNPRCQPAWSDKEIKHKIKQAGTKAKIVNPIQDRPLPDSAPPPGPLVSALPPGTTAVALDSDWKLNLRYNQDGKLTKDVGNVSLILKFAPGFCGSLAFDAMSYRVFWCLEPQFEIGLSRPQANQTIAEHHAVYVQQVLAKYHNLSVGKDIAWSAIEAAAHENEIHPVRDYLKDLQWDGTRRLHNWLHKYVGCQDTDYNALVGRWWLISAVARALEPGCQADHAIILEGAQGAGKSQAIRALGVNSNWVLGSLPDIRDHARAADAIGGKWIVEIAELDALKGAGMTRIKDFISQQTDSYRPAYARATIDRPRSCVFIGTTNETNYLTDPTGARRFWPVRVETDIDLEGLRRDRDQLYAEAVLCKQAGEQWHPNRENVGTISEEQSSRYVEDEWSSIVNRWIRGTTRDEGFTMEDILAVALNIEPRFWDKATQTRVGAILTKLGYTKKRIRINGDREYRYVAV